MPFFVKRNGQAVPIVSEPNVINDTTASQNTSFSGSKVNNLIANHTHASNQINAMTGYSKPSSTSNITPADSLNTAIGKVEKGLEGKQSPLSLGQYSGLDREIQILDNEEVGQTWYNTGVVDIEPSSSEGKLTISKVDNSVFPGSAPYTSEDIDIPGWEKVENSPITTKATGTDLTLSTSEGTVNALTVYGKSEVVDGSIKSAGEGYAIVDLGTLNWTPNPTYNNVFDSEIISPALKFINSLLYCNKYRISTSSTIQNIDKSIAPSQGTSKVYIKDTDYTDATAFKNSLNGVILAYQLADPTQGNTIAVKTDNGSGIDGTMAVFETGTPLYGVSDTVRDVMTWDGSSGEVTQNCGDVDLGTRTWYAVDGQNNVFRCIIPNIKIPTTTEERVTTVLCARYARALIPTYGDITNGEYFSYNGYFIIKDTNYTDATDFKTAMNGVKLIYELATPTTQFLTSTENASIAGLKTFEPQTHAQNNAQTDMTVEAYAGTSNGQAVTEIADKLDALTPKIYSLFIAKTDWDETGTVEIDVPGTFGYDIPSENYNQLVLSDEQTDHWRRFNVSLDSAHDASGKITTIEFSCDPGNIPDRPIYFNIVSSRPKYVDWSVLGNLIVPPGLQVDTSLDSDSTNPVQNKVITAALGNKADTSALDNYVEKEAGKSLSTNDYTDADKALVQDSPITVSATGSDLTLSTSSGNVNALTVYGKSEVVDGSIISAGEGYAVVNLSSLTWQYSNDYNVFWAYPADDPKEDGNGICNKYPFNHSLPHTDKTVRLGRTGYFISRILIKDTDYTTVSDFVASLGDSTLCYQLANPTQDNTIAVKTDNGSGIDGTMATFTTGTPLRGIPDTNVRDVMQWDGSAGTVTKNCNEADLGTATYTYDSNNKWFSTTSFASTIKPTSDTQQANILSSIYAPNTVAQMLADQSVNMACATNRFGTLIIRNTDYTDPAEFKTAMSGVMLVYELATPTTQALTSTENASIAGLRTFTPQTHAQNNAGATMTVEAYAGTANGKAVNELKQDVQSEISALKITRSDTLTLTTSGWSNNAQTVTYAHDTTKRNVIDVDPASVEEWASCGILATAETATSITFTCKTVPTNALTFRVTSMGV